MVKYLFEVRALNFEEMPDYFKFRKLLENLNYGLINRIKGAYAHLLEKLQNKVREGI